MQRMKFNDYGNGDGLWFTSDTHFGHAKCIEYCDRPFADVNEMNEKLIENWNAVVAPSDTVWHLGDFAFGGDNIWENILPRLNGNIHLILGNHDEKNIKEKYSKWFASISYQEKIIVAGYHIYLNHFPLLTYAGDKREHFAIQLHGHLHIKNGKCGESLEIFNMLKPTQYDVGVDNNNYFPISWKETIMKINERVNEAKGQ